MESIRQESHQYAQNRWYKLQSQAALYDNRERIQAYLAARAEKEDVKSKSLAYRVIQDIRAHHRSVIEFSSSSADLWRSIRKDAKAYERDQTVNKLPTLEKERFIRVEKYVEAKRAHAMAWREIFETKKITKLSNEELNQLSIFAKIHTDKRDVLAANILKDIPSHRAGLLYYHIPVAELDKPAYAQVCRERVNEYIAHQKNVLKRANIALIMLENPKTYHAALMEKSISWKDIYRDAKIAERKSFFDGLSSDEKRFYRTAEYYQAINRRIGKSWAKISVEREAGKEVNISKISRLDGLKVHRDQLAIRLLDQRAIIERDGIFCEKWDRNSEVVKKVKLDWKKVERQVSHHQTRMTNKLAKQPSEYVGKLKQQIQNLNADKAVNRIDPISQGTSNIQEKRAYYDARFIEIMKEAEMRSSRAAELSELRNDKKLIKKPIKKLDKDFEIER